MWAMSVALLCFVLGPLFFFPFFKMDVSSQELRNTKSVPHIDFKPRKYNAVRTELRIQIVHRLYQMPPPTYYYVSLSAKSQASALLAH